MLSLRWTPRCKGEQTNAADRRGGHKTMNLETITSAPKVGSSAVVLLPVDPPQNCAEAVRNLGIKCGEVLQSKSAYSDTIHTVELLFIGNEATVWKITNTYQSGFASTSEIRWPALIVGSQRSLHEWQKQNASDVATKPASDGSR